MAQDPVTTRRSITLKIDPELANALKKEYSICCSWGFFYEQANEPTYNIVGWSSDRVLPRMTIHWSEKYRVSASDAGCIPKFFVDSATESLEIKRGETFVFDAFDSVSIRAAQPPSDHLNDFGFATNDKGCSIVLERGLDLGRENDEDNFTPMFIASSGKHTFPVPTTGYIRPANTILIWFQSRSQPLSRRKAFDKKGLSMQPLEYNYGDQSTPFTKITLDFMDGRPQLLDQVEVFPTEARMLMHDSRKGTLS